MMPIMVSRMNASLLADRTASSLLSRRARFNQSLVRSTIHPYLSRTNAGAVYLAPSS
jgi:hypothetical protein